MNSGQIRQIALIGQPNVGKSTLFTRLTGVGVISSNYPGTTVEFEEATLLRNGKELHFHDLPGTYSLSTNSDDERVVIEMLMDNENDAIILVADAMDMTGSLTLCYEVMELGIPVIMALNRVDVACKRFTIDVETLSGMIGIPVVPVSAKTGKGIEDLLNLLTSGGAVRSDVHVDYDSHVVNYANELSNFLDDGPMPKWGRAIKLLEGVDEFTDAEDEFIKEVVMEMRNEFRHLHDDDIEVHIATDRFIQSSLVVHATVSRNTVERTTMEKISDLTIEPVSGIAILLVVMASMLFTLVYAGQYLDSAVNWLYDTIIGTAISDIGEMIGGEVAIAVFNGIDGSFRAILALVIPYIMVFYILLGLLEDTGYLPRVVVLLDRIMHHFGLHGGGFIPMMVGVGCNVPAILATRSMSSRRERRILCSMIIMCVPCSAQLAIIVGTTGTYAGLQYSALIALTLLVVGCAVGMILNRVLPSEPSNLAMELPDLTFPSIKNVLYKMWSRTKDFFSVAVPILIVGSIGVELLISYDVLGPLVEPMSFLTVTMLGLPAVTIIGFIVGILRKEMAYGMLLILAGTVPITEFMTPHQFVVFGMVMATYLPCLATLGVLFKEMGAKDTVVITCISMVVSVALGTLYNFLLAPFF